MKDIKKLWDYIEEDIESIKSRDIQKGILKRSLIDRVGLFIGIDIEDNNKLLIQVIDSTDLIHISDFPKWEGTFIEIKKISKTKEAIVVKLINIELIDIFNSLTIDIFKKLENTETNEEAVQKFCLNFNKWNTFFKKYGIKILSEEKIKGLFGELYFLKNWVMKYLSNRSSLDSWIGYESSSQDFTFINGNVEVKTTSGKQHKKISISNEKQLDKTGLDNLFLYCLTLHSDVNSGLSLPELIIDLKKIFSKNTNNVFLFEEYLLRAGYIDEHSKYYLKNKYIIKKEYFFEIDDDFPKITDPPEGVGDIRYSVVISSCIKFNREISSSIGELIDV